MPRTTVVLFALLAALLLPPPAAGQSGGADEARGQRVTGQVHRTIRRAGRGPLPRAVHGVRVGNTAAAVAGRGVRPAAAPGPGAFGPPARSRRGIGGSGRGIGILPGLPRHRVHGPLLPRHRGGAGIAAAVGPGWLVAAGAAAGVAERAAERAARVGRYAPPPPEAGPALPRAAEGPRGVCAVALVRMAVGPDRRLRIATGRLGTESPSAAEETLRKRLRRGAPLVLRGWDGPGLIVPGALVRDVRVTACPEPG